MSSPVPVSYDLLISSYSDLTSFTGVDAGGTPRGSFAAAAIAAGKGPGDTLVVAIAPGDYAPPDPSTRWGWTIKAANVAANGADVLLTGLYPATDFNPTIESVIFERAGVAAQVRFEYVTFTCRRWEPYSYAYAATGAVEGEIDSIRSNSNKAFAVRNTTGKTPWFSYGVVFRGNYRGDISFEFDPTGRLVPPYTDRWENRYPEGAHIMPTLSSGQITALVPYDRVYDDGYRENAFFVGDNCNPVWIDPATGMIEDGWHPVFLHPTAAATGSGFDGEFHTTNGRIDDTRVNNPGSGYSTATLLPHFWITWQGRKTLNAYLPSALLGQYDGASHLGSADTYIEHCLFTGGAWTGVRGIAPRSGGRMYLRWNTIDRVWADGFLIPQTDAAKADYIEIIGNLTKYLFASDSDPQNAHSDALQLYFDGIFNSALNIAIGGNIYLCGRNVWGGGATGLLTTDMTKPPGAAGSSGYVFNNIWLTRTQANGQNFQVVRGMMFIRNTSARYNVVDNLPFNQNLSATRFTYIHGNTMVSNNVAEGIEIEDGASRTSLIYNTILGRNGVTTPYGDVFENPTGDPLTREAARKMFATKGAHASRGAFTGPTFNWATLQPDWDAFPLYVDWREVNDHDSSTDAYSEWSRILGGNALKNISISGAGFTFDIADDIAGTNAVTNLTSATDVARDACIRIKLAAPNVGLTKFTATVTIDGQDFTWSVTTASLLPYIKVTNQDVAYSDCSLPSFSGETADRAVIAMRLDIDAFVGGARFFGATGVAQSQSWRMVQSASLPTFDVGTSGTILRRRIAGAPDLDVDQLWVMLIDLTQTDDNRCRWLVNRGLPTVDSVINGTATSMNMDNMLSQPFRLGADYDGSPVSKWRPTLFFADWGKSSALGGSYVLPDISTPEAIDDLYFSFQRDLIGADGSGPLGRQPKICFWSDNGAGDTDGSDAETWNATGGLSNRGTITTALIRNASGGYYADV